LQFRAHPEPLHVGERFTVLCEHMLEDTTQLLRDCVVPGGRDHL
jgi:hypothetical protein